MLVRAGPTGVVETHSCCPVSFRCQFTPHASAHPIRVSVGHLKLKCRGRHVTSYCGSPVELRSKIQPELAFCPHISS